MNIVFRNCLRPNNIKSLRFFPFSTAPNVAEMPAAEEPDKLYKIIQIELKANEPEVMKSYAIFAQMAAEYLGIKTGRFWAPPKPLHERDGLCLLRSVFVNKNSRTQYEVRTYFRYMNFLHLTGSTADTFLEYLERNLPEGTAMKITKVEVRKMPKEITKPNQSSNEACNST